MWRSASLLVSTIVLLLFVSKSNCAVAVQDTTSDLTKTLGKATKSYGEQLAEKDFLDVILYAVPATRPGMAPTAPFWKHMEMRNTAQFSQLTHWQQAQLAGWIVPGGGIYSEVIPPDGRAVNASDTFMHYLMFETDYGRPPLDAADILDKNFGLMPTGRAQEEFESILRGDPTTLPRYIHNLINPQTRKLYASFDGSVPEPGGLIFRKVSDIEEARQVLGEHAGLITERFAGAYEVKLQGTKPGEILDTGFMLLNH